MAGSGFDDPSDPGYVEFLEGKFLESQRAGKDAGRIESALDNIMHRLDTLETRQVQQAPVQAPAPLLGGEAPHNQRAVHDNAGEQGGAPPRSAADAVSGPLTEALRQLSISIGQGEKAADINLQFDLDAFVNFSCIESVKRDGMFYNDLVKPPDVRASGQRASDVNNVPGCIAALNDHHRTFTPIVIGGLRSQMNFDGWSRELSFEPDIELREYLRKGIFSGFDIVDRDAVIEPYERQNYNSVLQGNAYSFIDQLICDELKQSKLVITSGKPACVHALGAVPKPDGKYRPITDCKRPIGGSINNYMESTFHTFSYNTVDNVCESMSRQCFMATVDIAAAYRSIAISPDQWRYQGVSWKVNGVDTYITDTRLCFGLRCAPYVFTQISDFIVKCLARRGFHRVISYLDDFLLFGDSRVECIRATTKGP